MSGEITYCVECKYIDGADEFHMLVALKKPQSLYCNAETLPARMSLVTKREEHYSPDTGVSSASPYKRCIDVNDGNCALFEPYFGATTDETKELMVAIQEHEGQVGPISLPQVEDEAA